MSGSQRSSSWTRGLHLTSPLLRVRTHLSHGTPDGPSASAFSFFPPCAAALRAACSSFTATILMRRRMHPRRPWARSPCRPCPQDSRSPSSNWRRVSIRSTSSRRGWPSRLIPGVRFGSRRGSAGRGRCPCCQPLRPRRWSTAGLRSRQAECGLSQAVSGRSDALSAAI